MRAAYQGVPGAFSHQACLDALAGCDPVAFDSFEEAILAVREGRCERAVIPVENTSAGPVHEAVALLRDSGLRTAGEHWAPVRLQLLAVQGAALADLRTAESHPVALAQCGRALSELGLTRLSRFDTAGAAREVAASGDLSRAAVASRMAGELYGLHVLRENIEDSADNRTRFLVLARG